MPYILENMSYDDIAQVAAIERVCFTMPWPVSAYKRELKTPESNRYIVMRYLTPEQAHEVGLPEPAPQVLTHLTHPELNENGFQPTAPAGSQQLGGLARLTSLLPWRKNGHTEGVEEEPHRRFPVVGYAGLWLMVDEGHVTTIGVHPDHRGKGAGELLFMGLVDIAAEMKAARVTLEVRVSNLPAQALYRKYGLEVAGVRKRYYSDNGEDAYIMWSEPVGSPQFEERMQRLREELAARLSASFHTDLPAARPVDRSRLQ
ncbi:MAG: [ribosomal protein S18]-alanine N-acetyltransferase [Chloroflexia bacterium]|jgi:ribosomal-protein-alanine N-acetyltransferase|nr:[ribosomal protein S18]-alanine N-acetyltransferase [Chloroflexia bacterium]